ncbi:hypothetical protein ALC57_10784, partial [Trachymyrmex cornetzi]
NLLELCLGGHNQNNNKCLNLTIWCLAKHLHTGSKVIESCAYLAIEIFNEGYVTFERDNGHNYWSTM